MPSPTNRTVKVFSSQPKRFLDLPQLTKIQFESYRWLVDKGLKAVFSEHAPIRDYAGKEFEVRFPAYWVDEPKIPETQARRDGLSFEGALRVKVQLTNLRTKEEKSQDIYFGDFPVMTSRGTFVINGVERTVVSQLTKSAGVYFAVTGFRERNLFGAQVLPSRGSWIEFDTDNAGTLGVRIDKKRRVYASSFLRVFGLETDEAITKAFADSDKESGFIEKTLAADPAKTVVDSYLELYRKLKPGELSVYENARSYLDSMFKRPERYDLGEVGRFKLHQRLTGKKIPFDQIDSHSRLLTLDDVTAVIKEIIRLNNDPKAQPDDIDHLGNRRIKAVGELLAERLAVGMVRMRRQIQDRMSTVDPLTATPAQIIVPKPFLTALNDFLKNSQLSQFMDQENPLRAPSRARRVRGARRAHFPLRTALPYSDARGAEHRIGGSLCLL
jgi:DNA-directed RNA polymerase subunit beta